MEHYLRTSRSPVTALDWSEVQEFVELSHETINIHRLYSLIGQKSHAAGGNFVDSSHQRSATFFEGTRPFRRIL